jgi:type VI secretion system secreted protein VgrG
VFDLTQARTLEVSGPALPMFRGAPVLVATRLTGHSALSELFCYSLELKTPDDYAFSPSLAANINLDAIVGTEVTCRIQLEGSGEFMPGMPGNSGTPNLGAGVREISGLVSDATLLGEEGRSICYGLTLVPWLEKATKNQNSRLFQDLTIVELTDSLLAPYGFPVEKRLIETYPVRDLQRQYFESDFQFLCRLWQEWGIYFWFEHSGGTHRLVLCDSIGAHKPHGHAYSNIRYQARGGQRIDEEHIHSLQITRATTTGTVSSVDYDYTRPLADMSESETDPHSTALANQDHYAWGDYAQPQAGASGLSGKPNEYQEEARLLARVRLQALRCKGLRAAGKGNLRGLEAGQTFTLAGHPQSAANRDYLVVSTTLSIENVGEETQRQSSPDLGQHYRCNAEFVVQPAREWFRAEQTLRKPRVSGPETARVVGPANQEFWTDAYGRIKGQFIWDRHGSLNERSSCWLRATSAWQGNEFGAVHLARIGQEVLVDFINGDPDLPIVTGRAVNALNMPPWELPANQALSGFRSREENAGRSNHLLMDDTNGKIQAQLSSDEGLSQLSLGNIKRVSGNKGLQEPRGRGFELRTDEHGAIRAGRGLLITTEQRPGAQSHVKDMGETIQRLTEAHGTHESLAGLAQKNLAQDADGDQSEIVRALQDQTNGLRGGTNTEENDSPEFAEQYLALASPAGIQHTTSGTTHLASGEHLAITTGQHVSVAAGKSMYMTIKSKLRIFVYEAGIRMMAGAGDIDIQALKDSINIVAKLKIKMVANRIEICADELFLRGGKSFITLNDSGIESGTPGKWQSYAATHQLPGPKSAAGDVPARELKICELSTAKAASQHAAIVPFA